MLCEYNDSSNRNRWLQRQDACNSWHATWRAISRLLEGCLLCTITEEKSEVNSVDGPVVGVSGGWEDVEVGYLVGRGATGSVYRATCNNHQVAVKVHRYICTYSIYSIYTCIMYTACMLRVYIGIYTGQEDPGSGMFGLNALTSLSLSASYPLGPDPKLNALALNANLKRLDYFSLHLVSGYVVGTVAYLTCLTHLSLSGSQFPVTLLGLSSNKSCGSGHTHACVRMRIQVCISMHM